MVKLVDRTGKRFGKLVSVEQAGRNENKKVMWRCVCDCGKETVVTSGALVTGNTTSCGCAFKEAITKHGGYQKGSYHTWRAMLRRCNNPLDKDYKRYGAVGVTVCSEWHDYLAFAKDMGEPSGAETLDRIDVYGNYCKENCRWASVTVQNRNIRLRKESKSGAIGVRLRNGKWFPEITAQGKKFYGTVCNTLEAAVMQRKDLERLHWSHN